MASVYLDNIKHSAFLRNKNNLYFKKRADSALT